jgi:hypothetical protein
MSNPQYTNRKLVVSMSPNFMVQAAHDTPIAQANLNYRHAQTTPAFHGIIPFREEQRSCDAVYVVIEELTGKIARFTIGFNGTSKFAAGWFAYLQGVAAAPTGTPANESQTIALGGATGGSVTFGFDHEGLSGTTSAIATSAATTAATIQAALEALRPIKAGNVAVSGSAGGPFTVSFAGGRLANANLPLITKTDSSTGGTGVVVSAGTDGNNKHHLITRTTSETPVQFSIVEGFDGETNGIKRYKNLVLGDYTVSVNRRGKMSITVVAFGDPTPEILSGYSIPACDNSAPVKAKDTRLYIGSPISAYVTGDLRELTYTESNNIDVSEDALLFDDPTPDQLKSGDPTANLNALILGSPTSALWAFADAENTAFAPFELALGRPGERLTIFAPNAQFRLDDGLIEFVGGRNVSAFRVIARPSPDGSNIVTRGEYHGAFTGQFLLNA